ncbi:MAG: hypothetical protein O2779_02575 [Nanoarchaeota archaeon]|nr:hypothetical protein [Nanoarchaeota archaeon]
MYLVALFLVLFAGLSIMVEAGILDTLKGIGIWGFIKTYFHYKVLINTALISGLLLLFYNWKFGKTEGKTKTITLVVLIIMVYFLSVSPLLPGKSAAGDTSKYKFIWDVNALAPFKDFFVGEEGLLRNPVKLMTFIVSFILLYTGFTFLKIGGSGDTTSKILAPLLSGLIAYNLTNEGVTRGVLVIMGMIVVGWMLYQQTKESIPNVYARGLATAGLVFYVGYWIIGFEGSAGTVAGTFIGAVKQSAISSFGGSTGGAILVAIVVLAIIEIAFKVKGQ